MTVSDLQVAKECVAEDPSILCVYRYKHVVTGATLYSIEHAQTLGCTLASAYVSEPWLIYTQEEGWME